MTDKQVAVALFFDDAELGGHLRTALCEHGAQIAHEGPLSSFDEAKLRAAKVDVLVVNLDDAVDDTTLDRIYGLIDAGKTPVVFNDAQASRGLDGWDRARWARHLASKVLNNDTIDPPRPDNAREVETPHVSTLEAEQQAEPVPAESLAEETAADSIEDLPLEHDDSAPDTETLAAELEALLASDKSVDVPEDEFGSGLKYNADDALPLLHDGEFGEHDAQLHDAILESTPPARVEPPAFNADIDHISLATESVDGAEDEFGSGLKYNADDALPPLHDGHFGEHDAFIESEPSPLHIEPPAFSANIDHLSLASVDDEDFTPPVIEKATLAQQTPAPSAPEWGFVEEDEFTAPKASSDKAKQNFGVEKVSAADYLAPDADEVESPIEPGMTLELVSLEEAIAPQQDYEPQETHLHELQTAFARLLVLGAARDSQASLAVFLAGLPGNLKLPILLTQHQSNGSAEQLAQSLATQSALPVKVAVVGMRAKPGEILLVPRGQQVRILRDGQVELTAANEDTNEQAPSIDSSFTMAANVFGRDALAIVFAGQATDAVAGAQAIHDRGGQVWVESSSNDHYANMVHGVLAERLASFSGSPQELAVRLMDDLNHSGRMS
jgi:two-component system chemotaxis response regulator CheB/chemosensory pili system protein ChpB (putative protein-glutamate methylesterase)